MTVLTHAHGGDLDAIQRTYGIPKEEIIDFSGNINPLGFPKRAEDALKENLHLICTYPDKKYKALKQAIGTYTGADPSHIVVGNGSTELISTFIQTVHAKHSIIMGPAYSEYEREVSLGGGKFEYFPLKEEEDFKLTLPALLEALTPDVGMFVACNPNNPTGTAIRTEEMRQILAHCKKIGASVMIDETYIEFSDILPEICSIPLVKEFDNLFVIRGTSKFFAAPGLRLGYAVTGNRDLIKSINTRKNPWTINSLAVIAGETMFTDSAYIKETKSLISSERARLCKLFNKNPDFKVYDPSANFVLVRILREDLTSQDLFDRAIRQKMMIRDCSTFPFLDNKYIRLCFMRPEDNDRLIRCLFHQN